jgi:polysaccharide biosynthesis protein PslG
MYRTRMAGLTAVLALALGAPAAASAGDQFYGMWTDHLSMTRAQEQADLDRQAATGAGAIREHVFWNRIERTPGVYDFTRMDQLVADAADRGLRILPVLLYPPGFYTSNPPAYQYPPNDPTTMGRFAYAFVRRYGPNGSFWCCHPRVPMTEFEVWNEPDYPAWWKGKPNAAEYALLLHVVSLYIHLADPSAKVMLGGLTFRAASSGYLDQLYLLGGQLSFDVLAIHIYGSTVADIVSEIREFRAIQAKYLDSATPLAVTEYGWADGGRGLPSASTNCQAALMYASTKRLNELRGALNLDGIYQFRWNDIPPVTSIWPYYAGLVRVDGTAKPALAAYTAAVNGAPAPAGLTLAEACPPDRQALG